jgi:hypothetical protein
MMNETHKLSGSPEVSLIDWKVSARATWRKDGPYIVDSTGKKVALVQGELADHEWQQRRIVAALNALQDTPTQFIEELLEKCDDNIILTLIKRDKMMAATLQGMEEKIAMHNREIEQLRKMMEACRIFEEQRAFLKQAPGATEYEGLLHALGLG